MKSTDSIAQLADALSKAQGEFEDLVKDSENSFFKNAQGKPSKFSSLAACINATKKAFTKYGLAIVQGGDEGKQFVETRLMHKSGEWISSLYPVKTDKDTSQGYGGGMTYARRYSYMAMAGLAPEDDDGESTMNRAENKQVKQEIKPTVKSPVPNAADELKKIKAEDQVRLLTVATQNNWKADEVNDYLSSFMRVPMMKDLTMKQAKELAETIKTKTYLQATGAN